MQGSFLLNGTNNRPASVNIKHANVAILHADSKLVRQPGVSLVSTHPT
jgi:hypothetical protein